jgi:hypothetical protein
MRYKLLLIVAVMAISSFTVKAQTDVPNYLLAGQIQILTGKTGQHIDSADKYMLSFKKLPQTKAPEIKYTSDMYDALIVFQTDENNKIQVIMCSLPTSSLSTAKKAISMMGMVATGTQAPPGYTAYATPKYAAFLNPELTKGRLSLVLVQGGK